MQPFYCNDTGPRDTVQHINPPLSRSYQILSHYNVTEDTLKWHYNRFTMTPSKSLAGNPAYGKHISQNHTTLKFVVPLRRGPSSILRPVIHLPAPHPHPSICLGAQCLRASSTAPFPPFARRKKTARPRFLIQISSPVPWPVSSLSSHWSLKWLWGALSQFYMQIGLHLGSGAGLLRAYLCKSDWVRAYCWSACAGRRLYFTGPAASVFRGVEIFGGKDASRSGNGRLLAWRTPASTPPVSVL